ncbi:hypothetical protein Acr_02g0008820 [Actinidia rufa]|uniref:Uncharacterized protein n=1 Tax=Actinidia rufa TaxID=165716 RepID=A0A7J0E8M3_9ERIC|nr:hypothetical protein Acr_02g0008820 [Actinidia rufa]
MKSQIGSWKPYPTSGDLVVVQLLCRPSTNLVGLHHFRSVEGLLTVRGTQHINDHRRCFPDPRRPFSDSRRASSEVFWERLNQIWSVGTCSELKGGVRSLSEQIRTSWTNSAIIRGQSRMLKVEIGFERTTLVE